MAKKQTRRSISVSRATYDRLKAFCESSGISMSQFVENRVGDVLSHDAPAPRPNVAGVIAAHAASAIHSAPSHAMSASTQSSGQGHSALAGHSPHSSYAAHQSPAISAPVAPASHSHSAAAHVPSAPPTVVSTAPIARPSPVEPPAVRAPAPTPLTSAAARIAVEPPPPVIKPKSEQPAPKPAEKRPDQIFTF